MFLHKKKTALITLCLAVTFFMNIGIAGAAENKLELTLEQALDLGLKNNKQGDINRLAIEQAKLKIDEDSYAVRRLKDEHITTFDMALYKYVTPISNQLSLSVAEMTQRINDDAIKLEVEKNYYDLLSKKVALQNEKNALERAKEEYKISEQKYKAGLVAKIDLTDASVVLSQKEVSVNSAKNEYDKSMLILNQSLGIDLGTQLDLKSQFQFNEIEVDLQKEIEKAYNNSISYVSAKEGIKIAEESFKQVKRFYPSNVFTYINVEHDLLEAQANYEKSKSEIEINVRTAYYDLLNLSEAYKTLQLNKKSATEAYDASVARYKAGVTTRIEVEKMGDRLDELEANLMSMIYNYNLAATQIEYGLYK